MNPANPSEPSLRTPIPAGYYAYALISIGSAFLTVTDLHRSVYSVLSSASLPESVASAVAGILNLVWHEFAFLVGSGLKSVHIFVILPFLSAVLSCVSGILLLLQKRIGLKLVLLNLLIGSGVALASLTVHVARGADDTWRTISTSTFLFTTLLWFLYFRYETRKFSSGKHI